MVSKALGFREEANDLLEARRDVEKYIHKVEEYSAAVSAAQDMFKSKMEELRKREEEKKARMEVQEILNMLDEKVRKCKKEVERTLIQSMGDERGNSIERQFHDFLQNIAGQGYSSEELKSWQKKVEEMKTKIDLEVTKTYRLITEAQAERKAQ